MLIDMNTFNEELITITNEIYTIDNELNKPCIYENERNIYISIQSKLIDKTYTTCHVVNRLLLFIEKSNTKTINKLIIKCNELYKFHYKLGEIPQTSLTKHTLLRHCITLKEHVEKIKKIIYKKSVLDSDNLNYKALIVKHDLVCEKLERSDDAFEKILILNNNLKDELSEFKLYWKDDKDIFKNVSLPKLIMTNNDIDKLKSDHINHIDKLKTYNINDMYKLKTDTIKEINDHKINYTEEIKSKLSNYELRKEIIENKLTIKKLEFDNSKNNTNKKYYIDECARLITKNNKLSNTNNDNEIIINKLKKDHTKFISEQNARNTQRLIEVNHKHTNAMNILKKETSSKLKPDSYYSQKICKLKTTHTQEIDQLTYEPLINSNITSREFNVCEDYEDYTLVESDKEQYV
jgi:hypothetical protein